MTPDVFKQISSLLKAYQEEVDSLTTRAKLGEAAFLEVFKQLYEAPDPGPAIAQGLVCTYLIFYYHLNEKNSDDIAPPT